MLVKNYLVILFRILKGNILFSATNILGLIISFMACALIFQHVSYEYSYDKYHDKIDQIFRIKLDLYSNNEYQGSAPLNGRVLGVRMKEEIPEVLEYARIHQRYNGSVIKYEEKIFKEDRVFYADSTLLDIFSIPFVLGNPKNALNEPKTAIISETIAQKYFGNENPIGKIVKLFGGMEQNITITGVYKDVPENSHFHYDILLSIHLAEGQSGYRDGWTNQNFYTYILLEEKADVMAIHSKIEKIVEKYHGERLRKISCNEVYTLQPLKDVHLKSKLLYELEENGNIRILKILILVAIIILIISWINYFNISATKLFERYKEIFVRRILGSLNKQLFLSLFIEGLFFSLVSLTLTIIIFVLFSTWLSQLTSISLSALNFSNTNFWLTLLSIFLFGVFLSSIIPLRIIATQRNKVKSSNSFVKNNSSSIPRKALVIVQYLLATIAIIYTLGINKQVNYLLKKDLGIDIDNVLVIHQPTNIQGQYINKYEVFRQELISHPEIINIAYSQSVPGINYNGVDVIKKVGGQEENKPKPVRFINMDSEYINTYGLEVIAGRDFKGNGQQMGDEVIVNEELVRLLGYKNNDLILNEFIDSRGHKLKVIGVIKDHHHESLKFTRVPLVISFVDPCNTCIGYFSIKLSKEAEFSRTLENIENKWKTHFPDNPIDYFVLEDFINMQYSNDRTFGKTLLFFTIISFIMCFIGLFGLTYFMAEQRSREIAIRKTLGSSIGSIYVLFSKFSIYLVLISIFIAVPIAKVLLNNWINEYQYKTTITLFNLVIPCLLLSMIAVFSTFVVIVKVARISPAIVLKDNQ